MVLTIEGKVDNPMSFTIADLQGYPQVSIENHPYRSGGSDYTMTASGASFNSMLDRVAPWTNATLVTFYSGTDSYSAWVYLSDIRADPNAMIAITWHNNDNRTSAEESSRIRNIQPSEPFGQKWVRGLNRIVVS